MDVSQRRVRSDRHSHIVTRASSDDPDLHFSSSFDGSSQTGVSDSVHRKHRSCDLCPTAGRAGRLKPPCGRFAHPNARQAAAAARGPIEVEKTLAIGPIDIDMDVPFGCHRLPHPARAREQNKTRVSGRGVRGVHRQSLPVRRGASARPMPWLEPVTSTRRPARSKSGKVIVAYSATTAAPRGSPLRRPYRRGGSDRNARRSTARPSPRQWGISSAVASVPATRPAARICRDRRGAWGAALDSPPAGGAICSGRPARRGGGRQGFQDGRRRLAPPSRSRARGAPGRPAGLLQGPDPQGRLGAAAAGRRRSAGHPRHGVLDHPGANRNGEAVGPWAGTLTEAELLEGLRHMLTLRTFDARMMTAQRQGKISFYMQHMGEEAVSCAFRKALEPGDMNFPTYRQAGLLIAGGYPMVQMMNHIYSGEADPTKGRQLPVLYSSKEFGFFTVLRQPRHPVRPGGRLGDGLGDPRRHPHRRRLGRRRLDRRERLPRRARLRLDLPRAGGAEHRQQPVGDLDLPGHRAGRRRHLRRPRPRLRPAVAAGRRQRLPGRARGREMGGRARAPQPRADARSSTSPTGSARIRPPTTPPPTARRPSPTPGRSATR